LLEYDPTTESVTLYNSSKEHGNLPGTHIRSVDEANDGHVYVGTENGLSRFNPASGSFFSRMDTKQFAGFMG
jgi:hypothetical protein